jgi:hypothetical protein
MHYTSVYLVFTGFSVSAAGFSQSNELSLRPSLPGASAKGNREKQSLGEEIPST